MSVCTPDECSGTVATSEHNEGRALDFMLDSSQTHVDGRLSSQIDAIGRVLLDG